MQVICAWCGRFLYEVENDDGNSVSHGICADCFQRFVDELGIEIEDDE